MNSQEIAELLKNMSEKEKKYAEELNNLSEKFRHPVLQALIRGIAKDSEKHSIFYAALAKLVGDIQPMITEEELRIIKEGLEKHIETEAEMIEFTRRLAGETSDPRQKLIFLAIYEDEVKHHKILLDIHRNIAEKEAFTEEQLWDSVWKDSPWHGAPGG